MTITGKKIITLSDEDLKILADAENLMDALIEATGENDCIFDFDKISRFLYDLRDAGQIEIDIKG